ncbi:hypothetical protein BDK51DRAFT_17536 [Blyttiomyces helicus]|uniref:STI1 domain-containing protein n=1 Tax=Blyttiomyces helicus TaxID=388810 RepID=A0A4P9WDV9_9FUNG|nr:hypothetical protein BDK51DRAFT_17536 [Blyttiomyces helicus]|eukprot:RKO90552.1 hypothetical protein BDK51DRAFT_17536 [Blyttiomyces helicus]
MNVDPTPAPKAKPAPAPAPAPAPEPVPEPEVSDEEREKKEKRANSDSEKALGNDAYKKRNFEEAIAHYDKAWDLDSTNIAVLTNKSAALFEAGRLDECIAVCEQAVEIGRELRADYKVIAKAFARQGAAYWKKDDLANSIKYYSKSLTEHRTPEVLTKLREVEKLKAVKDKEAYRDPAISDQEREKGNELFKQSLFSDAVKHYSEAIKRNDKDARNFSNRAACYMKLMAMNEADKDCDEAIRLDGEFVKAYIRKAAILFAKREYIKCAEMCDMARSKDPEGKHTQEIDAQLYKANYALGQVQNSSNREEVLKRARDDPEVQAIMADPVMNTILKQMQEDPAAAKDHMKNPGVAAKIRTLINAGIISYR